MKKLLLLLLTVVMSVTAWADTVTSTFTDNKWSVGTDEPKWVKTGVDATAFESASPSRGVQTTLTNIKSYGLSLKNTTIKNLGNITGVSLVVSANGTGGSISSVKVGSTTFKCNGNDSYAVSSSNGQTPSFTNATAVSGDIVITFASTATSKSLYVKSITVTYQPTGKTALGTPTNLATANVTDRSATLSWDAVANAASYVVNIDGVEYAANTNSYNATGLTFNTDYSWSVKALAGDSEDYADGVFSTKNNFTTGDFVISDGTYNIVPNNALWGTSYTSSNTSIKTNELDLSGSKCGVSFNLKNGTSTSMYVTDAQTRVYNGYSLKIDAPSGYILTNITFTADGTNWTGTHTANVGTMTDNKTWDGYDNSVTISFMGTCRIVKISVTYEAAVPTTATIAITTPEGYSTFVCENAIVMPEGVEGSTVTVAGDALTLAWEYTAGTTVPANTPILVKGTQGNHNANITTGGTPAGTNYLVANTTGAAEDAYILADDLDAMCYVLSYDTNDENLGFYWYTATGDGDFKVPAGKVFLAVPGAMAGAAKRFVFGDMTGINAIESVSAKNNVVYNLAGQRVANGVKGIVIVNGKKMFNK